MTLVWIKRVWALPAPRVSAADVDRDLVVGHTEGVVDRACPRRDLPPGRRGRPLRRRGRARVRDRLAQRHGRRARPRRPRVDDPARLAGVSALGVDETAFQAASARRSTSFVTGIVDLSRTHTRARLLDVVPDRSASGLVSWLDAREPEWRAGIAVEPRWTPTAATPRRCAPACPTRPECRTRSMSYGSGSPVVSRTRSRHVTCAYSWMKPPSRSRRSGWT